MQAWSKALPSFSITTPEPLSLYTEQAVSETLPADTLRFRGLDLRVQGLGSRVWGLGFGVWGLGLNYLKHVMPPSQ